MVRYLLGVVLGVITGVLALSAVVVLFPSPDRLIIRNDTPPAPETAAAPGPQTPSEPAPEPAVAPVVEPAPAPEAGPQPEPVPAPEPAPAPAAAPEAPAQGAALPAAPSAPEGPALGSAPAVTETAALPGAPDAGPQRMALAPVVPSSPETAAAPSVNTESAGVPQVSSLSETATLQPGSALEDNAVPFTGDPAKPLMAVILLDEGSDAEMRAALSGVSAPITMAVLPDLPDAAGVARSYRDQGFEVVAALPVQGPLSMSEGMTTEAIAPILARVFESVPVATAVMDAVNGPLPRSRELTGAALEALAVTGHGLLTFRGTGLNNVPLLADEAGVYSDVVFRVIDDAVGSENILKELDRSALDASRGGSVVVLGRLRQETIATLVSWLFAAQGRDVTLAPVSAVLR